MSDFAKDKDVPDKNVGDTIYRQSAIDSAKEGLCDFFGLHADDIKFPITNTDYLVLALNKNITARISSLPSAQPEQRWIPVTERLPEHGIDVLTVDGYGEYELNHIIDDEGEWYWEPVAAWMPLPEWKGGEVEKMTREEAIETLKANYPDKCFELLRNAVDIAIKALSAEPEPRWIPVEEKSPKPNEIVIISVKGEVDADWIAIDSTGHGRWYRCMKDIVDIDAWMPLPEPWCYRARKKEK